MKLYKYTVVREYPDGTRAKRTKTYECYVDKLKVGSSYTHLGYGFPGIQHVLSKAVEEVED